MARYYVTSAIPYVNGRPHIGHALELVQTDVLARHRRQRGDEVRYQTGTDDNALKNVQSATAEGISTQEYVDRVANRYAALRGPLALSFDDFIKTSSDPRHVLGVERLWRVCEAAGDFYQQDYEGLYCVGCEQFYAPDELVDGKCDEHGTVPELVRETNWFFRLSRYQDQLLSVIKDSTLRIEPEHRRNEVVSFIEGGLENFSISRSVERAKGWGIRVPGDPSQVIYVWWDALVNYISALGYGTDPEGYARWWSDCPSRIHVIGKGILRFHAVYWPAMLLSAGEPLPTTIYVHEYLTARGQKISKSAGNADDPSDIAEQFGTDALRWWLLRDVTRVGDTDYVPERLVARANEDLANKIGNLVNRTVSMVTRYRNGNIPQTHTNRELVRPLAEARERAAATIDAALEEFDFRKGLAAIVDIADEGNRFVEASRPWDLFKAEQGGSDHAALDAVLGELVQTCREIADHLTPFLPSATERIAQQCGGGGETVESPTPLFPRLELPAVPSGA